MAAETLSSISTALSQVFAPQIARQWNRSAVTAALISLQPDGVSAGRGKNVAWDVAFSGNSATTVAEGSDVQDSELASDTNVPAVLSWAHYRSSFKVSETELDAAASSVGVATALMDIFGERIMNAGEKMARVVNVDLLSGTGTDGSSNPTIVGLLGGALETTGSYAGLSRATYSEWQGNVMANGGVARPLTLDLLYQMDQNIFTASMEMATHLIVSPGVYRKYASLFEAIRRIEGDGRGALSMGSGAAELFFKGLPVLRDPSVPAGTCIFFNNRHVKAKYLPRLQSPQDAVMQRMSDLVGGNGADVKNVTAVPARVAILAKTGDSVKVSLKTTLSACVTRPNALGYISDISEV